MLAPRSGGSGQLSRAFIFDLVDLGREYLSIEPCLAASSRLSHANTTATLTAANASLAEMLGDLDRLLSTSDGFLLVRASPPRGTHCARPRHAPPGGHGDTGSAQGQWVGDARALAETAGGGEAGADFLEWNARAQVTSWVPSMACDGNSESDSVLP